MGIKGLNQLLKKICSVSHLSLVPICNFSGKTIAVDATLYVCMFKMRSNYIDSIVDFLTMFRENRIDVFFVFDGIAPDEKNDERSARSDRRIAQHDRIQRLERDLEIYKQTNEISELLKSISIRTRRLAPNALSIHGIQEYIDRLKSQVISLTYEDFQTMKTLLDIFGIPYTTAAGEGEFLCAALNRHGLVDAVMTADTDALPCLAPTVINKVVDGYFQVVSLHDILSVMRLDEKQFVDLCIMCGTDFNPNIQRIGPMSSYDLILRHKSIDKIPIASKDCLNHIRVREIFGLTEIRPTISVPKCSSIDFNGLKQYVRDINLIKNRINKFTVISE